MSDAYAWADIIFDIGSVDKIWENLFSKLNDLAQHVTRNELHKETQLADRLLAESAWELWLNYQVAAPRASTTLQTWWQSPSSYGQAILIMDALSLRELPILLKGAEMHNALPFRVRVVGSEAPSDTDQFAQSLGAQTRSALKYDNKPEKFVLGKDICTDVMSLPFTDCLNGVSNNPQLLLWHTWLDDQIHQHNITPTRLYQITSEALQAVGFWALVNRLRQGRHLVITADHGYAESRLFTEEKDKLVIDALRTNFGASRYKRVQQPWAQSFMPPNVIVANDYHIVIGQRKWPVQGGFPPLSHGGLSLLEIAVPFIEFTPL